MRKHHQLINNRQRLAQLLAVVIVGMVGTLFVTFSHATTPTSSVESESGALSTAKAVNDQSASGGAAVKYGPQPCVVTAVLVNPCRPWLGAVADSYSQVASDTKSQLLAHESRLSRQLDVVHTYHPPGSNTLSATDLYFANRANTILMTNWKPATNWSTADGSSSSVNAAIDSMATSIKAVAPHKVMLSIFHEPENDVSSGAASCASDIYKGSAGTPAEYRAMWANVENRFAAQGVGNVVWVMNYIGFSKWNCMVKDMWPGNNLVDWVVWDPYVTPGSETFNDAVSNQYDFMNANSDSSHDFTSKPWGLNEWNIYSAASEAQKLAVYTQIKADIDSNVYPRMKLYNAYDSLITDNDFRIGCNNDGGITCTVDQTKQDAYNAFANDPKLTGSFTGLP